MQPSPSAAAAAKQIGPDLQHNEEWLLFGGDLQLDKSEEETKRDSASDSAGATEDIVSSRFFLKRGAGSPPAGVKK